MALDITQQFVERSALVALESKLEAETVYGIGVVLHDAHAVSGHGSAGLLEPKIGEELADALLDMEWELGVAVNEEPRMSKFMGGHRAEMIVGQPVENGNRLDLAVNDFVPPSPLGRTDVAAQVPRAALLEFISIHEPERDVRALEIQTEISQGSAYVFENDFPLVHTVDSCPPALAAERTSIFIGHAPGRQASANETPAAVAGLELAFMFLAIHISPSVLDIRGADGLAADAASRKEVVLVARTTVGVAVPFVEPVP
jgi:hypothetical protein